jgi:GNAT superfamily N-acetyltransferase
MTRPPAADPDGRVDAGRVTTRRLPAGVALRPATVRDAAEAPRIISVALNDLYARQGRPAAEEHADCAAVYGHLAGDDATSFWVAEAAKSVVGFSVGVRRSDLWFLSALFVLSDWQGRGLGQALLERAQDNRSPDGVAAVLSSAYNELSNRLYARRGMAPLLPVLQMTGALPLRGALALPAGLRLTRLTGARRCLDALRAIDEAVLGIDRSSDHRWLLGEEARDGWLAERRGRAAAYAYLGGDGTEGSAVVGPAAALRAPDIVAVVAFALGELAATGVTEGGVMVAGANLAVQRLLWEAGFQFHGATALLGATRPFGRLDRYVFAGNALM